MVKLIPEIEANRDQITAWRRHFHQNPEASLKEFETAKTIRQILTDWGLAYDEVGETGSLAYLEGTQTGGDKDRSILLRADIDALEITEATSHDYPSLKQGLMHACGHDAHTAALLGAVNYLKDHRDLFAGKIYFAFQQAEEIGSGAYQFVESGLIDGVDQAFAIHVDPSHPVGVIEAVAGPTMASCDIFTIKVKGKSAHVARPHEGIDALAAGAQIVVALQNLVSRRLNPLEPAVIGIGNFQAGTRYNIVANSAEIQGTLRSLSHETRAEFIQLIEETSRDIAKIFGAEIEFSNYDAAAPNINHTESAKRAQKVAGQIVGRENVVTRQVPSMGADDFADIIKLIPGVYTRVGVSSGPETSYGLHHEKFNLDEAALPIMSTLHVSYALDFLND